MRKRIENPLGIKKLIASSCLYLLALMATLAKAFGKSLFEAFKPKLLF
jgi:hypothetical protein